MLKALLKTLKFALLSFPWIMGTLIIGPITMGLINPDIKEPPQQPSSEPSNSGYWYDEHGPHLKPFQYDPKYDDEIMDA